ncbi:lens fiber membrane intrinsic protein-like isoform X3 [Lathamus discolor]|uniref:lens fiber membrane intrinsic protein-like isoform X3 n=1 Tax=Lathamus discolor TaxID=678569 RepID=UPI0032B776EA
MVTRKDPPPPPPAVSIVPPPPPQFPPLGTRLCCASIQNLPHIVSPTMALSPLRGRGTQRDSGAEGGAMPAGGGLLCGASGLGLLLAATATSSWLQRRGPGGSASIGLWRVCGGGHCGPHPGTPGLLALLGLGLYTAGTPRLLGPARAAWRFSWSYILGWVAAALISSAGLFHLCSAHKDPSPESSEEVGA